MNQESWAPDEQTPKDLPEAVGGRWIALRPVSRADYSALFQWRVDIREMHIWMPSRRIPTWEEFVGEIEQLLRSSMTLLAIDGRTGNPMGFVQAYNVNTTEGWCYTLAYASPGYLRTRQAAEMYIAFLDYLFSGFPFRKIYADVFEFNMHPVKPLMAGGFVEEGRFREHTWHDDRYWDVIRLAMYREKWNEVRDRARLLLGVQQETEQVLAEQQARVDGHA